MTSFMQQYLQGHFVQTLSWTLFHSLWQAAFFAALAGIAMQVSKNSTPGLRYNILGGIFLSFTGVSAATFIFLWTNHSTAIHHTQVITGGTIKGYPLLQPLLYYFREYSAGFFGIWLMIFLLKSIRLIIDLKDISRIRHTHISSPDPVWQQRFRDLAQRLNLQYTIQLIESGRITIPATVGFLKPCVLLPLGLLSRLPPYQIEAILLHELAHIKRNDFLNNTIQKIVETLFFFNPFLLWIAKLLREEREHCCDEIVLAHTQDKKGLIQALISFREYQLSVQGLHLNFGNNKAQLLQRVKRMASQQNKVLSYTEKLFVTASLLLFIGMCCSVCSPGNYYNSEGMISFSQQPTGVAANYEKIVLPDAVIESVNMSNNQDTLKVAQAITDDLIRHGIISTRKALHYQLNHDALIVNGIRQSDILHEQLKLKYIHEKGWALRYENLINPVSDNNMT